MKDFLIVLIDNDSSVIWTYRAIAESKVAALNLFASYIVENKDLQQIINKTKILEIMEG